LFDCLLAKDALQLLFTALEFRSEVSAFGWIETGQYRLGLEASSELCKVMIMLDKPPSSFLDDFCSSILQSTAEARCTSSLSNSKHLQVGLSIEAGLDETQRMRSPLK
jgi:hypothetical protein